MAFFLRLENAGVVIDNPILSNIDWQINEGENWAITGPTGSGKTLLAQVIAGDKSIQRGRLFFNIDLPKVSLVNFERIRSLKFSDQFYYQQRFNSTDTDKGPDVCEFLGQHEDQLKQNEFIRLLGLEKLLQKKFIQLSNGETKKILLTRAILQKPDLLILDNPLVGLDKDSRTEFLSFANHLVAIGQKLIFIGEPGELPSCITHIAVMNNGHMVFKGLREDLPADAVAKPDMGKFSSEWLPVHQQSFRDFKEAARLENIHIQYGNMVILDNVSWAIERGSKWALRGPNGSGKSTLLSIITGDNPQAYANEVWLFDRKRGTGESIWEIKNKIGFMSPELQLYSDNRGTCMQVALSGFADAFGIQRTSSDIQKSVTEAYFNAFDMAGLMNKPFYEVSTGEQRLVLLVRALVKNPPLLILDEPCQGLDAVKTAFFNSLIDYICEKKEKTLVYVSHYAASIPSCIDREMVLR